MGKWLVIGWSVVVELMVGGGSVGRWPMERENKEHFRICEIPLLY